MKINLKKLLTFTMALGMTFSLAACGEETPASSTATETEKSTESVLLYDFEWYRTSFHPIRISDFGKIERSADYAKSGTYSAKLLPGGNVRGTTPSFNMPLQSNVYDFAYNMIDYRSISCSVYNAEEEAVNMTMGLICSTQVAPKTFALQPGWNDIEYVIEHNFLNVFIDYFEDISSFYFAFENSGERDLTNSDVLYLDDIILNPVLKAVELQDIKTLKKYEILDFEDLWQDYVMEYFAWEPATRPIFEGIDYRKGEFPEGAYPSHGNRALKATFQVGDGIKNTWPEMIVPDYIVKNACSALTEEELENAYICYDLYNVSMQGHIDRRYGDVTQWGPGLANGEWTTLKFKLTDCVDTEVNKLSDGCGDLDIILGESVGTEQVVLLDNVRLEVIVEE